MSRDNDTPVTEAAARPRKGLAEKRDALVRAGRAVFGRDGYSRASVDAIACEAGVSTRTVYNHFEGKEELFGTVVMETTEQVRDGQLEMIDRHLGRLDRAEDLERDFTALARALALQIGRVPEHYALARHINAEAGHVPCEVIRTWYRSGAGRVHEELTRRIGALAERGLLRVPDAERAAVHFVMLTTTEVVQRSFWGVSPLEESLVETIVTAGVRTWLRAYAAPRP